MGRRLLAIEDPPVAGPRWGHGRPPHARLVETLGAHEEAYRRNLDLLAGLRDDLARIDPGPADGPEPSWRNRWLPALDAAAIYGFVRTRAPARYLEVGSGMSTRFAARAIRDGALSTRIMSIDPHPRSDVEELCERSIRRPLETLDLGVFDELGAGDVLFVDGSHRALTNSDATVFFLDVLPSLRPGVLVGIHDILLPDDYLPEWAELHWSEQYLMAAWLLGGGEGLELQLASHYVTAHSDLHTILDPLWDELGLEGLARDGFALWFETTGR